MNSDKNKILFIFPKWPVRSLWGQFADKFPALGLLTIAAVTPPGYRISLTDENIEDIDFSTDADIIAISVMTPLADRAYAIAGVFRAKGKTVVLGGIHVSALPDEAAAHCDSIVIGEGERSWLRLLSDYRAGSLKPRYQETEFLDMNTYTPPRRDILRPGKYLTTATIQLTRGCPHHCEYCSVTAMFGRKFRSIPVDDFVSDYLSLKERFVFIVDDNIASNKKTAFELFSKIENCGKWWGSQVPITVADDPKLLTAMQKSGCKILFIGFESLDEEILKDMGKTFLNPAKNAERIKRIHDHGIAIQGSFMVGCDRDNEATFSNTYEFIVKNRIETFIISVLTPFPGIKMTENMEKEGRIFSRDWSLYDMNTVVYRPKTMTPDELQKRYNELNQALLRLPCIARRVLKFRTHSIIMVPQNLGFRAAWKRTLSARSAGH